MHREERHDWYQTLGTSATRTDWEHWTCPAFCTGEDAWIEGSMIQTFRIMTGIGDLEASDFFTMNPRETRGNGKKIMKQPSRLKLRKFSFSKVTVSWSQRCGAVQSRAGWSMERHPVFAHCPISLRYLAKVTWKQQGERYKSKDFLLLDVFRWILQVNINLSRSRDCLLLCSVVRQFGCLLPARSLWAAVTLST